MGCKVTKSIPPCASTFSVSGVQKVWLARKANATEYRYALDEMGIIQYIMNTAGNPTPFYEFECDSAYVTPNEDLAINERGKTFPQSITMRFAAMDYEKRAVLESIINDKTVCVYLDANQRYWLLGQDHGLQCVEYNGTPDVANAANRYTCKLQGLERYQQREVYGPNFIYVSPNSGGGTKTTNLGGGGINGGITAVLNTWGQQAIGGPWMPLSQLGNAAIIDVIQ